MEVPLFLEETLHGQSREISYKLPVFDELGRVSEASKTLNVKIPAGGRRRAHSLKGQGVAGVGGGQNGDCIWSSASRRIRCSRLMATT